MGTLNPWMQQYSTRRSVIGFRVDVQLLSEIRKARSPVWLNRCESLVDVLKELQQRDVWPGIEIVWDDDDERESAFYVGPVVYVEDDLFGMRLGYEFRF